MVVPPRSPPWMVVAKLSVNFVLNATRPENGGQGDLREAELTIAGLVAKSAQQERPIAHLERFNALVLEENEDLRWFLANGAVAA